MNESSSRTPAAPVARVDSVSSVSGLEKSWVVFVIRDSWFEGSKVVGEGGRDKSSGSCIKEGLEETKSLYGTRRQALQHRVCSGWRRKTRLDDDLDSMFKGEERWRLSSPLVVISVTTSVVLGKPLGGLALHAVRGNMFRSSRTPSV